MRAEAQVSLCPFLDYALQAAAASRRRGAFGMVLIASGRVSRECRPVPLIGSLLLLHYFRLPLARAGPVAPN
jgi:hypothetical protein